MEPRGQDKRRNATIDCAEARELLPLFVSGELAEAARYEAHLASCPYCAQLVRHTRELDGKLRQAVLSEPVAASAIWQRFRGRVRPPVWKWAAAAALVIAAAGGAWYLREQPKAPAIYLDAMADHNREIVMKQPRRWILDTMALTGLATAQGVSPEMIQRLAPAGYRFEEGKVCRLHGQPYLHLVYENGGDQVSVFFRRYDAKDSDQIFSASHDGQHAAGLDSNGLRVMYVADDADRANQLAEHAAELL